VRSLRASQPRSLHVYQSPNVKLIGLAGLVPVIAAIVLSPLDQAVIAVSLGALVGAGIATVLAFVGGAEREPRRFGAWDVAGILAFVGFGAGMIAQPEKVLRFFGLS
jgi:hypothetical protein